MKLVFIGTGSAFTVGGNYQSNMFFENDSEERLLIDCGSDVRHGLYELGLNHRDFQGVYISHLHADHTGGLEWLAFTRMFDPGSPGIPQLYCHESMANWLWSTLSGGLNSLENTNVDLSTYFDLRLISNEDSFNWSNTDFQIFRTDHQVSNKEPMPCFGLKTVINNMNVLLTTDSKFPFRENHPMRTRYKEADIIFQDCETSTGKSTVHAHYTELITLDPSIRQKMWLYHYHPGELPDAKKDGFRGFIQKGQVFDFEDPSTLV